MQTELPQKNNSNNLSRNSLLMMFHKDPVYRRVVIYIETHPGASINDIKKSFNFSSESETTHVTSSLVELGFINNINNRFFFKKELENTYINLDPISFGKDFKLSCLKSRLFFMLDELSNGKGHISDIRSFATSYELVEELYNEISQSISKFRKKSFQLENSEKPYILDLGLVGVNGLKEKNNENN